jgi:peptide/nickel transport system permease protein
MLKFIYKRFSYGLLVIFGVAIVVFFIFHALPGDPVAMMAGQRTDVSTRDAITKELGLDKPIPQQLALYINDLSPISIYEDTEANQISYEYEKLFAVGKSVVVLKFPYLRRSFQTNKKVSEILYEHFEGTFWLTLAAMLFATTFGILMGVWAALNPNKFIDHFMVTSSVLGVSIPSFVASIFFAILFADILSDYTGLEITGQLYVTDAIYGRQLVLKNLILPAFTLGIRPLAIIVQLTRSSMMEVMGQDYIRTARAKGLTRSAVIFKHALKNALNPVITAVTGWLASLLAGAFFVEMVFNWKGLGLVTINAVYNLDFPVVMGATLLVAAIFVIVNMFVDILYAAIDPRVRLE